MEDHKNSFERIRLYNKYKLYDTWRIAPLPDIDFESMSNQELMNKFQEIKILYINSKKCAELRQLYREMYIPKEEWDEAHTFEIEQNIRYNENCEALMCNINETLLKNNSVISSDAIVHSSSAIVIEEEIDIDIEEEEIPTKKIFLKKKKYDDIRDDPNWILFYIQIYIMGQHNDVVYQGKDCLVIYDYIRTETVYTNLKSILKNFDKFIKNIFAVDILFKINNYETYHESAITTCKHHLDAYFKQFRKTRYINEYNNLIANMDKIGNCYINLLLIAISLNQNDLFIKNLFYRLYFTTIKDNMINPECISLKDKIYGVNITYDLHSIYNMYIHNTKTLSQNLSKPSVSVNIKSLNEKGKGFDTNIMSKSSFMQKLKMYDDKTLHKLLIFSDLICNFTTYIELPLREFIQKLNTIDTETLNVLSYKHINLWFILNGDKNVLREVLLRLANIF